MDVLIALVLFLGLFALLIWGGSRLFANFERKIDRQFEQLASALKLTLKKDTPAFPGRTWIAPSLEGMTKSGSASIFMEEERVGGNRLPKTIIEIRAETSRPGTVKCCRKLPATTLLKLAPNVKVGDAQFDRTFVLSAMNPAEVPDWLKREGIRREFLAGKKDFNNGLLSYEGQTLRFEWPYFFYSDGLRESLIRTFNLLLLILEVVEAGHHD